MTRFTPLWAQDGNYAAGVDRRLISALWPGPASGGAEVTPTGAGMQIQAAPGSVAVPAPNGSGSVLCAWDAPEVVNLDPSPPSGTNRIDVITVQTAGSDIGLAGAIAFTIAVVKGGEAASPVVPAIPAGAVALANIAVNGGAASIVAANITDRRPFGLATAGGSNRPPLAAGAPLQSFVDPSGDTWVARGGVNAGAWRRARDVLAVYSFRSSAAQAGASTGILLDGTRRDPYGLNVGGVFVLPVAGLWRITWQVTFAPSQAGVAFSCTAQATPGPVNYTNTNHSGRDTWGLAVALTFTDFFAAGTQLGFLAGTANPNQNVTVGQSNTFATANWEGSG